MSARGRARAGSASSDERTTWQRYQEAKAKLSPEQIERIKAKCEWEHMTWLGVFEQWPSLFGAQP